jgi:hypothetical protein
MNIARLLFGGVQTKDRAAVAEAAERDSAIAHAMTLGASRNLATVAVKYLRNETSWSWPRIREEITRMLAQPLTPTEDQEHTP